MALGTAVLFYQRRAKQCPRHHRWAGYLATVLGCLLVLFGAGLLAFAAVPRTETMRASNSRPQAIEPPPKTPSTLDASPQSAPAAEADPDRESRRLVVGTWTDNYQGKRTMTLNDDGTGTMIVELSGMKARLFAARLDFEMVWSLESGRLKKQTLRGEPATQVAIILKTMGDRVDEPILELTSEKLVLLDKDGQTRYTWSRVSETP